MDSLLNRTFMSQERDLHYRGFPLRFSFSSKGITPASVVAALRRGVGDGPDIGRERQTSLTTARMETGHFKNHLASKLKISF